MDGGPGYNRAGMNNKLVRSSIALTALTLATTLLVLPGLAYSNPAPAAQPPTPFPTPTPNQDGEIIYEVQTGDTAWRIAAIAGITLEELYALNGLEPTDFLSEGTLLVLGRVGPAPATAPPGAATPTEIQATPTPVSGTGEICALLFEDVNGNAQLDEDEVALAGGQVSVVDANGQLSGESTTETEPPEEDPVGVCFPELEDGDYNVSGAVPEGYNPTTSMNAPVRLNPGEVKYVEFGAQASSALGGGLQPEGGSNSLVLGVVGLLFLLAAGALGVYAARYNRRSPRSLR
jgi:hypothetical protein